MADTTHAEQLFFTQAGLDKSRVQTIVDDALNSADDGELFRSANHFWHPCLWFR